MVMDFVEGKCLDVVLKESDHLEIDEAIDCFIQLSHAMAHAHDKAIIHRDLKPSNIMLSSTWKSGGSIKVLDFGCGKLRDLNSEHGSALTQEGLSLGTPSYMSPEQVRGLAVDGRSDIYSLGCVMYEALTSYVLHVGDNAAQTMLLHLEEDVPLMREMNPDLSFPDSLERIVARMVEKDVEARYQSMLELKNDLIGVKSSLRS